MNKNKTRQLFGSLICFLSLVLLLWAEWPIKPETREIVFQPGELQVAPNNGSFQNTDAGNQLMPQAFQDERIVRLEWIPIIRMGDTSQVKLGFIGNQISRIGNSEDISELPSTLTKFENVFDSYSIAAEARLALLDMDVIPSGVSGQVLLEGQDITFIWKIAPKSGGLYEGTTWLYLHFFPIYDGEAIEQAVSAQAMDIKVVSLLGIKSNYWRILGVLGLIIGFCMQKKHIIGVISRIYK
jgi:hypothetical protein